MSIDLGPLRDLALDLNLAVHGFAVTVTRPPPDNTPITTRGLWLRTLAEGQAVGTDYRNRRPRVALVLPRDQVPNVPRGTAIVAPERLGGPTVNWTVDGYVEPTEHDHWVVAVQRA